MQVEPDLEIALIRLNLIPAAVGAPVNINQEKRKIGEIEKGKSCT
jgi:hypothetical protein